MLKELFDKFHLGLFEEGGEGGDAGAEGEGTETAGEEIPSSIPARARDNYRKALEKTRPREARAEEVPEEPHEPGRFPRRLYSPRFVKLAVQA